MLPDVTALNQHYETAHPTGGKTKNPPKFKCDICGKGYAQKHSLRYHVAVQHAQYHGISKPGGQNVQ